MGTLFLSLLALSFSSLLFSSLLFPSLLALFYWSLPCIAYYHHCSSKHWYTGQEGRLAQLRSPPRRQIGVVHSSHNTHHHRPINRSINHAGSDDVTQGNYEYHSGYGGICRISRIEDRARGYLLFISPTGSYIRPVC
jgi:hypothetical protein